MLPNAFPIQVDWHLLNTQDKIPVFYHTDSHDDEVDPMEKTIRWQINTCLRFDHTQMNVIVLLLLIHVWDKHDFIIIINL